MPNHLLIVSVWIPGKQGYFLVCSIQRCTYISGQHWGSVGRSFPTVHLHKRLTLGTQYGRKLLNSTNRRWELKIDDLLFVFRLPTVREQRDSACPTFLTSPNGKIRAILLLRLWVSCFVIAFTVHRYTLTVDILYSYTDSDFLERNPLTFCVSVIFLTSPGVWGPNNSVYNKKVQD